MRKLHNSYHMIELIRPIRPILISILAALALMISPPTLAALTYPIVDTGQTQCYNNTGAMTWPAKGAAFHGQDAQYAGLQPTYRNNGDGTINDLITGLMWTQVPAARKTYPQAVQGASKCTTGGYSDWRLPAIKELYSLILFSGTDPDPMGNDTSGLIPFIDDSFFRFEYGDPSRRERFIDAQYASSTKYVSTTMNGMETVFGVNFADGRIKGYGLQSPRGAKTFYVLYVRKNQNYGKNKFRDNRDGTITAEATGLTWMKTDSEFGMDCQAALDYAENLTLAGHSDWRLPNAKELQSIVDYARSPDTTGTAAIDPIFSATPITNESGQKDFAQYWTSTTHVGTRGAQAGAYVAFGRSLGFMRDRRTGRGAWMDVHGAGSQRSDPKAGDASAFPAGRGPQGDVIRIENLVRCVRGGGVKVVGTGPRIQKQQNQRHQRPSQPRARNHGNAGGHHRGPSGADFVKRLDRDGDGQVSKREFDGPANHFAQFDRNGDGYLTEDEAPKGPPPGTGPPPRNRPPRQ